MPATNFLSTLEHPGRTWWHRGAPYSRAELFWDGAVHIIGLALALGLGGVLVAMAGFRTAPALVPTLCIYVASLAVVLGVSMAFNLAPISPVKRVLARLDQAGIFLLIAGTYTPILATLGGTTLGNWMLIGVWAAALIGVALKLLVPERFGRAALVLYLGIGWSGVAVFQSLAATLPPSTLWLLLAGGVAYCSGIIFHLWERLHFHNVLWHCFVVIGAGLHLWAILDCMVLRRL
ncbi:MAG: hemolysin family protein [Devosia sp.]|uniref:PAQR family membrane homeostasis protein TrhA n=1 Tax=Devosia sp. TaxID=1871048 RepID=UPI002627DEC9|nr:hemolysin III family protein [Devosia sp.]MDB5539204.1 hemolysin family protein [Devosia sp.]